MKLLRTAAAAAAAAGLFAFTVQAADIMNCPPPQIDETEEELAVDTDFALSLFEYDETAEVYTDEEYPVDENGHTQAVSTAYSGDNLYRFVLEGSTLNVKAHIPAVEGQTPYGMEIGGSRVTVPSGTTTDFNLSVNLSSASDGTIAFKYIYKKVGDASHIYLLTMDEVTLVKEGDELYFQIPKKVYDSNRWFLHKNYRVPSSYVEQNYPWVQVDDEVKGWAEEITAGAETDYDKIKAVHDWVSDNVYYDYVNLNNTSLTLLNTKDVYNGDENGMRYSVCQGYSSLCAGLLRSLGIPCKVVSGYGNSGGSDWDKISDTASNHAWNEARCADENRWIVFDSTWDSGNKKGIGNGRHSLYLQEKNAEIL